MKAALKTVLAVVLLTFSLLVPTVLADAPQDVSSKNFTAYQNAGFAWQNFEFGIVCDITHISPFKDQPCIGNTITDTSGDSKLQVFNNAGDGGAIGMLSGSMVAMLSNPPASVPDYMADVGSKFGLVQPAYAQSVTGSSGGGVVAPVLGIWTAVRNLAYLSFIIVFIVVGFMIMLRQRINPQTVASIQSALPGLVMGLILVTFSYFIAAFLIDLSFVGMQVVAQIFNGVGNNAFGNAVGLAQNSNVFQLFSTAAFRPQNIGDVTGGILNVVSNAPAVGIIGVVVFGVIGGIIGFILGPAGSIAGAAIGAAAGPAAGVAVISLLIPLILIIALFVQMFRLLFQLINSYIQLLIYTMIGPLFILAASLPGRGGTLGNWWRCILANSLVFPAVFGAFLFAGLILGDSGSWTSTLPLFAGVGTNILRLFVAYGIILGTPAIPPMVRQMLGCKGPETYAQAAIAGFGAGFRPVAGATNFGRERMMAGPRAQREAWQRVHQGEIAEGKISSTSIPANLQPLPGASLGERANRAIRRWYLKQP